ncbi:hypothetical protein HK097_004377 [Rhizophlyctis rosea]|uniref:DDHD domain-containing protein n=1 Tax=Rhizophlyctis rosea TaxID=64517 RepID=A0AAD5SFI5_9FUNG|nr:hypothetical protein HK097_004377 [Rhizophlyctis rosea]
MEPAQQQLQTFGSQPDVGQPYLKPRWFHAVDVPKADTTPFKVATAKETPKAPAVWKSFTAQNSAALETAYQRLSDLRLKEREKEKAGNKSTVEKDPRGFKVHVNEDNLFEADVEKKEYYPIYWHGPTYDIRRGTWFFQSTGNVFFPCDENLARQIEDGYRKFQPWKESTPAAITPSAIAASPPKPASAAPTDHGDILKPVDGRAEARWPLLGPYIGQYVIFAGAHNAWQFSDQLASKLTRAVMNMGGTRLVRGWDEVSRLNRKASRGHLAKDKTQDLANQAKGKETTEKAREGQEETSRGIEGVSPANGGRMTSEQAQKLQQKMESEDYDASQEDPDRKIDHLMLVIHGIGQKLGERMEAVNFVHDCNVLRRTFKDTAKQYASVKEQLRGPRKAAAVDIPDHGGVQLLPVQWRHRVNFGAIRESNKEDKNGAPKIEQTTLEDITLDGVPSIRMLVSDVILDGKQAPTSTNGLCGGN